MNLEEEKKEQIQKTIINVLENREIDQEFIRQKNIEEIMEEFSVYHQELKHQNEELRRVQMELEKSKAHYYSIFNNAPLGYVVIDEGHLITAANQFFESFIGEEERWLIGRRIEEWVSPESQDAFYFYLKKVVETGANENLQLRMKAAEGERVVKLHSNLMESQTEKYLIRIALVDLTREKEMEEALVRKNQELEKARKKAECASRVKTQFLANMSHEIRTPLNGILGFLQLMGETDLDEEQREYLEMMNSSSVMLRRLLDDLLDLSSIESEKVKLNDQCFNVESVLTHIVEKCVYGQEQDGVKVFFHHDHRIPEIIFGDQERLQQILMNLMGNAVKFTKEGKIALESKMLKKTEEIIEIQLSVKDTGIGIEKKSQDLIFESFNQADSSSTRKYGGSGLGLTITKKLVEAMGGSIHLESKLGEGSCFTVIIPFALSLDC
ncbi:PAS domain-containing sensor histidine kinase [Tindallia californiensis]|uniref:Circadian input-output histidine kinase CikA n=1 Tax=Tindallia californiensis TaxID=159292 RepID=A0A1H3LI59_9FIRM|nr:ATP-binding protein [Tindallia californiensis]SDY64217.1 PAS domain S-box-containing protein [Tindallia californiensis]